MEKEYSPPIIELPIYAKFINKKSVLFGILSLIIWFALGYFNQLINQTFNTLGVISLFFVAILCIIGLVFYGMLYKVGKIYLDKELKILKFEYRDSITNFSLDKTFECATFCIPPVVPYLNGGKGLYIRQGNNEISFWFHNKKFTKQDKNELKYPGPACLRTNEKGADIYDYVISLITV